MILNNDTQKIVDRIALELHIPKHVATVAYRNYWMFIKETIGNLPDLTSITEEEFDKLQVNFNIPSLGKFTTNYKKVSKANKFKEIVNERISNKSRETIT